MSGIYIKSMEMPEEGSYEAVFLFGPDGKAEIAVSPGEGKVGYWKEYQVISVPPHGRLGDLDALKEKVWDADTRCGYVQVVDLGDILEAKTIIPASE